MEAGNRDPKPNGVRGTKRHEGSSADVNLVLNSTVKTRGLYLYPVLTVALNMVFFLGYSHASGVLANADTDQLCCVSVSAVEGTAACALVEHHNHM